MTAQTLLLTPWMIPHKIIPWQTAVTMSFLGKVDVLEEYDEVIRSPSLAIKAPAVVRLRRPLGGMKRGVKFSRINVFARDDFRCQYCGTKQLDFASRAPLNLSTQNHFAQVGSGRTGMACLTSLSQSVSFALFCSIRFC